MLTSYYLHWDYTRCPSCVHCIVSASSEVEYIKELFEVELDHSGSELITRNRKNCRVMETVVYLVCIAVASFVVLAQPAVAQGANTILPLTYPGQVLQGDGSQTCPSEEQREIAMSEIKNATQNLLGETVIPLLRFSCGGSTGWRHVAYLNMSNPSQQCPSVWREYTTPHRVCGRRSIRGSCEGLTYSTGSEQYDQVCGRIIGYQLGNPDAFDGADGGPIRSIDSYYMDGVSLTYGSPRQHIWSFVGGLNEGDRASLTCPCVNGSTAGNRIPSFIGQNYFCESGLTQQSPGHGVFHPNGDPLWDGQGCGPTSSCCTFNSPPWFNVQLSSLTTGDIEVRICGDGGIGNEDTPIQLMELYVK